MRDLTTARFLVGRQGRHHHPATIGEPWESGGVPAAPPRRDSLFQDFWRLVRSALS